MFLAKKLLSALLLPPAGPILLAFVGLWLAGSESRRWRTAGRWLAGLSLVGLLVLAIPATGSFFLRQIETHPPAAQQALKDIDAIVVLGGGSYYGAPEYGADSVSHATLERIRYAAHLARTTGRPILVTGGAPHAGRPEALSMKQVLEQEFKIPVRWMEDQSRDTKENAQYSAAMLRRDGMTRIALVSHAWHLPRAIPLFEREDLHVLAAPTAFSTYSPSWAENLMPQDFRRSRQAMHEWLGQLFNKLSGQT